MITIDIIYKQKVTNEITDTAFWSCWLKLADGQDTYYLPATAPADTPDLTTYFQVQADRLWTVAKEKGIGDLCDALPERAVQKAMSELARGEINALHQKAGLGEYSKDIWEQKLKDEVVSMSVFALSLVQ